MTRRTTGTLLLALVAGGAIFAPVLTPSSPIEQFSDHLLAPPMRIRVMDDEGRWRAPFVYPLTLADRLERRYVEQRDRPVPIRWFRDGVIASIDPADGRWFPLGTDALGRDVFSRLVYGARISLALAVVASAGALVIGILIGGTAGVFGGRTDAGLMLLTQFVLMLPAIYVVLAFRVTLPLVLTPAQVFWSMTGVLALAGWPLTARGVRTIVRAEHAKEYAEAAYAAGAGRWRILLRHLLPATCGFLTVSWTLMVPAAVVAEATLSLVGLGFPVPSATWGTLLREAWQGGAVFDAPWLLTPAVMLVALVLGLHLVTGGRGGDPLDSDTFL